MFNENWCFCDAVSLKKLKGSFQSNVKVGRCARCVVLLFRVEQVNKVLVLIKTAAEGLRVFVNPFKEALCVC